MSGTPPGVARLGKQHSCEADRQGTEEALQWRCSLVLVLATVLASLCWGTELLPAITRRHGLIVPQFFFKILVVEFSNILRASQPRMFLSQVHWPTFCSFC